MDCRLRVHELVLSAAIAVISPMGRILERLGRERNNIVDGMPWFEGEHSDAMLLAATRNERLKGLFPCFESGVLVRKDPET
jgi:hypothetical protein